MRDLRTSLLKKLLKAHLSTLEKTVTSEMQRQIIRKDIHEINLELVRRREHLELVHTESSWRLCFRNLTWNIIEASYWQSLTGFHLFKTCFPLTIPWYQSIRVCSLQPDLPCSQPHWNINLLSLFKVSDSSTLCFVKFSWFWILVEAWNQNFLFLLDHYNFQKCTAKRKGQKYVRYKRLYLTEIIW